MIAAHESNEQPVTIYLTRHGETTGNVMHLMQGWSDFPLSQRGQEGTRALGRGLQGIEFAAAYSGNLPRQWQTARNALDYSGNKDLHIGINPDLREANFGSYEGHPSAELMEQIFRSQGCTSLRQARQQLGWRGAIIMQDKIHELDGTNSTNSALEAGDRAENSQEVADRMGRALTRIAQSQAERGGGNVLVVSSGTSIELFLLTLEGNQQIFPPMLNNSVTKLLYSDSHFQVQGPIASPEFCQRGQAQ